MPEPKEPGLYRDQPQLDPENTEIVTRKSGKVEFNPIKKEQFKKEDVVIKNPGRGKQVKFEKR